MTRVVPLVLVLASVAACRKAPVPPAPPAAAAAPAAGAAAAGAPADPTVPPPAKPMPATLPAVVAKVNGEAVEKWELENAIHGIEARAGQPIPADRRDAAYRDVLSQIIDYHVLAQQSKAFNLPVTDAEVSARMAQVRQQFPTEDAFKQALVAQGMTIEQLHRQTLMSLEAQKIVETQISPGITVQDADVDAFYKQNPERFKEGEAVHAAHILIRVAPNAEAATKAAARGQAEQILKEVRSGADFATLAKQRSQDPGSATNGGDLGFFPKGQMDPAFEAAAFSTRPGATSGVVESSFGFHILKVFERRNARTTPLAEVSGRIKQFLTEQQRRQKLDGFVQQARAKSKIEILV